MSLRAFLPCALAVSGCAKGGVEIVVHANSDQVNKVVLVLGVGDSIDDPIMPARAGAPYPASSTWSRDQHDVLDERAISPGEPAVFQFQGEGEIAVAIAVGASGDTPITAKVKHALEVPGDHVARYTLHLDPLNDGTNQAPLYLTAWETAPGSPLAGKRCVAVYDKPTSKADAITVHGDPDCDGWPTGDDKECAPLYYMSFTRPTLEETSCMVTERVVTGDGSVQEGCVLGGPPCRDGVGKESGCTAPSAYCLPKSVCNQCGQLGRTDVDCAKDPVRPFITSPSHLKCALRVDVQGNVCPGPIMALANPQGVAGHACLTGSEHPALITTAGAPWDTKAELSNESGSSTLKVELKNLSSSCNFEIFASGQVGVFTRFGGLVAGKLDNGRGIAVPIVFEVSPTNIGCDEMPACAPTWSWDLAEVVDQCVSTPVFPP